MSMIFSDSYVNQTSGIALTGTTGVFDKQVARVFWTLQIRSPVLVGIVRVDIKWTDRAGVAKTKTGVSIPLAIAARYTDDDTLYFDDTGSGAGVPFEFEVVSTGVAGTFSYDFAVGLEDKFIGN